MFLTKLPQFTTIAEARRRTGVSYLGGINTSSKLQKNLKVSGHYTYIVYLAPANTSGFNVCACSTAECRLGCLATSGRARMELTRGITRIEQSRVRKTVLLKTHPEYYLRWLFAEISAARAKAVKDGYLFSVRLNGTSDVDYTKLQLDGRNVFETFPDVTFYDYTKDHTRFVNKPDNYHLTFSYTGRNWNKCKELLDAGVNIAMVFNFPKEAVLPTEYSGYTVVNGDLTDLRVDESKGVIIGLYWKNINNSDINNKVRNSIFAVQPDDVNLKYKSNTLLWHFEKSGLLKTRSNLLV